MLIRKIKKIFYRLNFFFKKNKKNFEKIQEEIFFRNKISRQLGLKKFNSIVKKDKDLITDMHSEHQIIFSAISCSKKFNIRNILEIGTYDGKNSLLLSKLFPKSKILTIDLPSESDEFKKIYIKNNLDISRLKQREKILKKTKNIIFKEINSIKLINKNLSFDLIWIDGAHGYPVVVIDIINSMRMSKPNCIILCDDIYTQKINEEDSYYFSNAGSETIKILKKEDLIEYDLFYKRVENKYNYFPEEKKYIAFIRKKNEKK